MQHTTGNAIDQEIVETLKKFDLDISDVRGQGYDGAGSMSSEKVGVNAYIKRLSPLAIYQHCCGHNLNLVIVHACKLSDIRNCIDKLKAIVLKIENSPKLEALTDLVVKTSSTL